VSDGPTQVVNVPYVVRPQFAAFHSRSKRRAILVFHRRAGKTVATVNDLVAKALRCRKKNGFFAYIAPYMGQAVQTAWEYLQEAVRAIPGHKIDLTGKSVKVPSAHGTTATIRLFGADNPNSLRGLYFDGVVLDEVAQMKKMVWTDVIQPALMDRLGWAVFIGTPNGKNFFYDLWETAKQDPETWFSQMLKASESGLLRQEDLDAYKEDVDEETYEQEMECSFTAGIKGAYYAKIIEKMDEDGRLQPFEYIKAAPVHVVLDLGWSDATAAWFFQVQSGQLDVIDHQEWNEIDIKRIIQDIRDRGYRMGDVWLPHDAKAHSLQTGKSMIDTFRSHGINPKAVPELGVLDGIQAVRQTLPKLRIDGKKCYQGVEALKNYQKKWNVELGVFSKHPLHDWASNSADSMRYLCLAVRDKDIAASIPIRTPSQTPAEARSAWLATAYLNTASNKGPTLDDLFAQQKRSRYVRI
jgi:phage terminase large subunit